MNLREARLLRPKEVAVLIRQALAVRWPKRKFSVRTHVYAGGASVRVSWPFVSEVDDTECLLIARQFQGKGFDGMNDSSFDIYSWLAPGPKAALAYYPATFNQSPDELPKPWPCEDAELVCFGVWVFAGSTDRPRREETADEADASLCDPLPF